MKKLILILLGFVLLFSLACTCGDIEKKEQIIDPNTEVKLKTEAIEFSKLKPGDTIYLKLVDEPRIFNKIEGDSVYGYRSVGSQLLPTTGEYWVYYIKRK